MNNKVWIGIAIGAGIGIAWAVTARKKTRWDPREMSRRLADESEDLVERGKEMIDRIRVIYEEGRKVVEDAGELWNHGRKLVKA